MTAFRFAMAVAALAAGCAGDRVVAPAEMRGGTMTDWYSHKTLYTFDQDSANATIFKRDDGSSQWAYKGKPLYFYAGDQKTGDRIGDKANGVWHGVK